MLSLACQEKSRLGGSAGVWGFRPLFGNFNTDSILKLLKILDDFLAYRYFYLIFFKDLNLITDPFPIVAFGSHVVHGLDLLPPWFVLVLSTLDGQKWISRSIVELISFEKFFVSEFLLIEWFLPLSLCKCSLLAFTSRFTFLVWLLAF